MSAEPLVFIILVNWNGKHVTLDCLHSLEGVTYTNFRVVVVDNASSDGSVEAIQTSHPDVTVLSMKANLRFAGGNNVGIQHALEHNADLLLLLNNDTTVAPDFLSRMVERIQSNPLIGMVAPKIYYHDEPKRIWFAGGTISMWTGTMRHFGIREIDRGQCDTSRTIDYATGCCVLARREIVEKIGGLDESYFIYAEDADWSMRARNAGYLVSYEPAAVLWHKLSISAGGHTSWFKMKNKFVSNFRFFSRHARWYHMLTFPWLNIVVNAYAATKYVLSRRQT